MANGRPRNGPVLKASVYRKRNRIREKMLTLGEYTQADGTRWWIYYASDGGRVRVTRVRVTNGYALDGARTYSSLEEALHAEV